MDNCRYIEEEDLRKFLTEEEVQTIFPLFDGALETGKIKKSAFRDWVVSSLILFLFLLGLFGFKEVGGSEEMVVYKGKEKKKMSFFIFFFQYLDG